MKTKKWIIILGLIAFFAKAQKPLTADSLLKTNVIAMKATGLGGYSGECINVEIENFSNNTIQVLLESGRRFVSLDSSEQDILVVKPLVVTIQPRRKLLSKLFGFCCQASKSAPKAKSKFYKSYMASKDLVELAQYLDSNQGISNSTIQNAVWAISDKRAISCIGELNVQDKALRQRVAGILKSNVPWYTIAYGKGVLQPGENIDTTMPAMFYAEIDLQTPHARQITTTIEDKNNNVLNYLTQNYYVRNGLQTFVFSQSLKKYKKGKYYLVIKGENGYMIRKEFEF